MSKFGVIIFSRKDSQRLPNKCFKKIGKVSLLEHIYRKCKFINGDLKIVIATSERKIDDTIEDFAKNKKISIFRGDFHDVANRAHECCKFFNFEYFVRICGDRPFFQTSIIDLLLKKVRDTKIDLATNNLIKTFPAGLICEVVSFSALKRALKLTEKKNHREHLTSYMYENKERFDIYNYKCPIPNISNKKFSVDNGDDLIKANWIYENYKGNIYNISMEELVNLDNSYIKEKN